MESDDKKYVALMAKYKEMRRSQPQEAMMYLDAAMELRERRNISEDAFLGGAYL